jgi:hypothetical protein
MQILTQAQLARGMKLEELANHHTFDQEVLRRLLLAMQQASPPPPPQLLGVLSKEHFLEKLAGTDHSFRYQKRVGTSEDGLPYVVEAACRLTDDKRLQGLHVGLNWAVPLTNPLQDSVFETPDGSEVYYGLEGLLEHQRVSLERDSVALVLHIAMPRFNFLDRGKGSLELAPSVAQAVADAVLKVIHEWAKIKRSQERDLRAARRLQERLKSGRTARTTVKEAAWSIMKDAYLQASGNGQYPANARQIMYAARGEILSLTEDTSLNDNYFTQELLPQYQREHPEETANWDVVYDDRGHLIEPHTGHMIGIGTLEVRRYLHAARQHDKSASVEVPQLASQYPTAGPLYRYGAILYIEKEGFLPLLRQARFAERYDLAIMSTKGMGSTAARQLLEALPALAPAARIFVLHDFDKSGFSIVGILKRDTERYQFSTPPEIVDLGVRLNDVREYFLPSEPVDYRSDSEPNLRDNGATQEEIAFLVGKGQLGGRYHGRRVELNAFTSDQFVAWLEAKLQHHKVRKVIPDDQTAAEAWRRSIVLREIEQRMEQALPKAQRTAKKAAVPKNLRARIARPS